MTPQDLITPFTVGSVFERRTLEEIQKEIRDVYLQDARPWVVGFSGGKDSTCTLQLVWNAISGLPENERSKPIHVISSDTLVETPAIVGLIDQSLERIRKTAASKQLPFAATKVQPVVGETFWVNLIGRGYPAPNRTFRWCTDRMKIQPADRFILEQVSKNGEVIVGTRRPQSGKHDEGSGHEPGPDQRKPPISPPNAAKHLRLHADLRVFHGRRLGLSSPESESLGKQQSRPSGALQERERWGMPTRGGRNNPVVR